MLLGVTTKNRLFLKEVNKKLKNNSSLKKNIEKPKLKFLCIKCNHFFQFEMDTPIDDIKCPKCSTYEIFLELEFETEIPAYYS